MKNKITILILIILLGVFIYIFKGINVKTEVINSNKSDNEYIKVFDGDNYIFISKNDKDSFIEEYDKEGSALLKKTFYNMIITDAIKESDSYIFAVLSDKQYYLNKYDLNGKLLISKEIDLDGKLLSYKNYIYLISSNIITKYDKDLEVIETYPFSGNMIYDFINIDNKIYLNLENNIRYDNALTSDGLGITSFDDKYNEIHIYSDIDSYNYKYTKMTYLNNKLYLINEIDPPQLISTSLEGKVSLKKDFTSDMELSSYMFTDIESDGKYIYVLANDKKRSILIVFDTKGKYSVKNIFSGIYKNIDLFENNIVLTGEGFSILKYKTK